jgi:TonB-linked SusC/RagA family outer membrane protein
MTFTGKVLLTMRLTALILLCACLQVCAKGYSQITLSETDAPLQKVFKEIQKQTGYDFLFSSELLKQAGNVTVKLNNVSLQEAVEECLKGKGLDYEIQEKTVIIKKKILQPLPSGGGSSLSTPPPIDIHGRVTDSLGKPLSGASVIVKGKGKQKGTETDVNGNFTLKDVSDNSILVISYTGYTTKQYKISGIDAFTVFLDKSNNPLDEIQVIAYGTTTKRLSTGDVTTVTAKEIEMQPVSNPLLALEGRVPGIVITQNTGVPGGGITVRIQGINSLTRGNDPLYIIDGVPYSSQSLSNLSGPVGILGSNGGTNQYSPNGGGNPLSFINPADIESIDVLKDADATSIYGSRAANGAVLITTKKGKAGQTRGDINIQDGWGTVTRYMPLLNSQQYLQMRYEAFKNDGILPGPNDYDINGTWDTTRYTNWQKTLIGGTAQYLTANGSVSGGTTNTQFLVGAGYQRQTTVFPGDLSDQKGSVHINLNHISNNQRFRLMADVKYLVDNNQLIVSDLTQTAMILSPDAPALYNKDGSLNWAPLPDGSSTWINPLAYLKNKYTSINRNLIGNALISYQVLPGLVLKSTFGYNNLQTNETQFYPLTGYAPDQRQNNIRISVFGNNAVSSWNLEPQVTYNRFIAKGTLEALVGATIEQNNSSGQQLLGYGYNSDLQLGDISSAPNITPAALSISSAYKYQALFGRLNYNWQNKYILNLTGRRDGSSRFGADNLFHNFWSTAGAWLFSNEALFKNNIPIISFGKLRASYGTTGNDQIGDYQFLSLYNSYVVPFAYQGVSGLYPIGLPNPHLQWEETNKLQFGLDLGFLKDRILLNINYYRNRSSNQLEGYPLPSITGFGSIYENFPATIENTGWEFTLNTINVKSRDFSWSSSVNLTIPKNRLVTFQGLDSSSYAYTYIIGQPVTINKAFHFLGVNPATGLYQYAGNQGPTSSPNYPSDATTQVNTDPKLYGGFQNSIRYKGLGLDFLFQFAKQLGLNYSFGIRPGQFNSSGAYGSGANNQPIYILDRWQNPGDIKQLEKFSTNYPPTYGNLNYSDARFSDASYIRLKNVSLSWQFPEEWMKKTHLQNCRIYAQGQNLLTITNYKGLDPENQSIGSLPPLKVLTFGILVSL